MKTTALSMVFVLYLVAAVLQGQYAISSNAMGFGTDDSKTVTIGNHEYYFHSKSKLTATIFCRSHGMDLVSLDSAEQNESIKKYIKNLPPTRWWTSGTDKAKENVYSWFSTGKKFTFTDWHKKEPSKAKWNCESEDCVEFIRYSEKNGGIKWNDARCSTEINFICQKY